MPASTPPRTAAATRQGFLDFFREKGHEIVPSAPLVPEDDPTLLFINAGMNPFKDVFLGTGTRPYTRVADTQKCLRVSGKHNDLEEVGLDTYHHTLFEMLGNWSFGDYFKREAISWAWELLVDRWGLEPDRLYATVHEGDAALGLEPDDEAAGFWRELTSIPHANILQGSSKDNFWMMGDTGPCGPCSELHYDMRPDAERAVTPGADRVNRDDPRVIEVWNLVFIQYNAQPDGSLKPLTAKHVDTGMGFERICAVLQGKTSNYDTDVFAPLLHAIADLSPDPAVTGYDSIEGDDAERKRIAMRVVADHVRTVAFAVADGAPPGNTGRGYVIRRILRRAVRFGYQSLGLREPFMWRLVGLLADQMADVFPDLKGQQEYVERTVRAEEEGFLRTLAAGLESFEAVAPHVRGFHAADADAADRLRGDRAALDLLDKAFVGKTLDETIAAFQAAAAQGRVPGEVAFLLHDTYGFPGDLTALMAREIGLGVDEARFDALMTEQRERARAAGSFKVDQSDVAGWQAVREGDYTFVGYETTDADAARILRTRTVPAGDGAEGQPTYQLVLDKSPFYAESGGQVGDTGALRVGDETIAVLDTQKAEGGAVLTVDRLPSDPSKPVRAEIEKERRRRVVQHHSATHLLHLALREVLGGHVQQKGSLVDADRLRFDFAHYERVTDEQLREVERRVNAMIQADLPGVIEADVPLAEARERGAMALFGEKYGERVRVVTFGPSVELCGGTHARSTGEIGLLLITSEGSVASGVRRIEAVAGQAALDEVMAMRHALAGVRGHFKALQGPVEDAVAGLVEANKALEKELSGLRQQQAAAGLDRLLDEAQDVDGVRLVVGDLGAADMDTLRDVATDFRNKLGAGGVAVLGATDPEGDKVYLAAAVADDVVGRGVQAGKLVGALAKRVGGGGGGRPQLATAGGRQPENLPGALAAAADEVRGMLR